MPNKPIFPTKDADFDDYYQRTVIYLNNNKVRLKISADNITSLNNYSRSWSIIYPQSQNPDERTTAITNKKTAMRKDIETLLRKIYNDIPKSLLTADDRAALNLKARDTEPTPAPVPTTIPLVELHGGNGSQIVIRFRQEGGEKGSSHRSAKPEKVSYMELCYKTSEPAPTSPDECNKTIDISKSPNVMNFDPSFSGKRFYCFGRWMNTRSQPGPWTALMSVIIP